MIKYRHPNSKEIQVRPASPPWKPREEGILGKEEAGPLTHFALFLARCI